MRFLIFRCTFFWGGMGWVCLEGQVCRKPPKPINSGNRLSASTPTWWSHILVKKNSKLLKKTCGRSLSLGKTFVINQRVAFKIHPKYCMHSTLLLVVSPRHACVTTEIALRNCEDNSWQNQGNLWTLWRLLRMPQLQASGSHHHKHPPTCIGRVNGRS